MAESNGFAGYDGIDVLSIYGDEEGGSDFGGGGGGGESLGFGGGDFGGDYGGGFDTGGDDASFDPLDYGPQFVGLDDPDKVGQYIGNVGNPKDIALKAALREKQAMKLASRNLNAQSQVVTPKTAVSATSTTPQTTPTLIQTKGLGGNHLLFVVLILAFVYFEWRK